MDLSSQPQKMVVVDQLLKFKAEVWSQLPTIVEPDFNFKAVDDSIEHHYRNGWTVSEAASHLRCCEELNPDLPEDVALARMARIRAAVTARQGD